MKFYDAKHEKLLVFLTNNFDLPALTVADLYRCRWQVELFFKRIKRFLGTFENAVKTQVWIAIAVYVLVAIVRKRMNSDAALYTLLQIFSLTLSEKTPMDQRLNFSEYNDYIIDGSNQLIWFN